MDSGMVAELPNWRHENIEPARAASVRLSARISDDLTPFVGFFDDEPSKVGGRAPNQRGAKLGKLDFVLGLARIALISLFSLSMISVGVPCGALTPYQALASPGTKSATVRKSGNTSDHCAVVTANGRNLPALMNSIDVGTLSNITCT